MKSIKDLYKTNKKISRRSLLLQDISDYTGIPFNLILRNTFHLKGDEGIRILEIILQDTLLFSEFKGARRDKAADLIRLSK